MSIASEPAKSVIKKVTLKVLSPLYQSLELGGYTVKVSVFSHPQKPGFCNLHVPSELGVNHQRPVGWALIINAL